MSNVWPDIVTNTAVPTTELWFVHDGVTVAKIVNIQAPPTDARS